MANPWDKRDYCFCSAEKEWLVWLFANNVSVVDFGLLTDSVLVRGEIKSRAGPGGGHG